MAFPGSSFLEIAQSRLRGDIGIEAYFEALLETLCMRREPEDEDKAADARLATTDPVAAALKECLREVGGHVISDATPLKGILLSCWNGDLSELQEVHSELMQSPELAMLDGPLFPALVCVACERGHGPILKYLLSLPQASPSTLKSNKNIAIAMRRSAYRDVPDDFLDAQVVDEDINLGTQENALHYAVKKSAPEAIKETEALLQRGGVVSGKVLHYAAFFAEEDTMRFLLSNNNLTQKELDLSSALIVAASLGRLNLVRLLVEHGATVDFVPWTAGMRDTKMIAEDEQSGFILGTPLHAAAVENRIDVVEFLLEKGARTDRLDSGQQTALRRARLNGHGRVVELITAAGGGEADPKGRKAVVVKRPGIKGLLRKTIALIRKAFKL